MNWILTVIGVAFVIVYIIRYTLLYQNRLQLVERKLLKVIRTLDTVEDVSNHLDVNLKRPGIIYRSVNEELYRPDLQVNPVYRRIYAEYESLQEYGEKFWRLEGPVYIAIIIMSFLTLFLLF